MLRLAGSAALLLTPLAVGAETVPWDSPRWEFAGETHRVETHLGQNALYLDYAQAVLPDIDLASGVIEFDVAFAEDRGFSGVGWHRQGDDDFEHFYLRPHQSGFPDACQYQPVFASWDAWQIYAGEGFGAAIEHRFDAWQRVRVVFSRERAEVFVDGESVLRIRELLRRDPGGGLFLMSTFAPAHFANFRYERIDAPAFTWTPEPVPALEATHVSRWLVSTSFDEEDLAEHTSLEAVLPAIGSGPLKWTELDVEPNGVANLARTSPAENTVLARLEIDAERAQTIRLDYGFSDRVRVFVKGRLVHEGNDGYRTRDHRFLGTVGLFDTLVVPLREGANTVTFAVSESFGGFAVTARLRSGSGLRIEPAGLTIP